MKLRISTDRDELDVAQFGFAKAAKPDTYMERYAPEIHTASAQLKI
ncbi:MAG TPA: hypothetical protein VFS47_13845 [Steroidobacteraceae bacterium]|nr:hypothetical protein [Steroidobacteraceae bacterium]